MIKRFEQFKVGMRVKRIAGYFAGMNVGDIGTIISTKNRGILLKEFNKSGEIEHYYNNLEPIKSWRQQYEI